MSSSAHVLVARALSVGLVAALPLLGTEAAHAAPLKADVISREGLRQTVDKLEIRGSTTLEYYVDGRRRQLPMARIDRVQIGGTGREQEAPVTVILRTGRVETGTIIIDVASSPLDDAAVGTAQPSDRLTGSTALGPLLLPLSQVREILFDHPEDAPLIEDTVSGTIIDERGKRFDLSDIRYRGDEAFRYQVGRKKRRVALRHVERLEFDDSPTGEVRPVTITYRTGRVTQGTVDASVVRLAGEGDTVYRTRVDSAFTGRLASGRRFGIGLHGVKLVLMKVPEPEAQDAEAEGAEAEAAEAPATPEAPTGDEADADADGQ